MPATDKREHAGGCGCIFCNRMKSRTMSLESWENHHNAHVGHGAAFTSEPFPHPSGTWSWIVCPCGAKILTTGNE